MHLASDATLVGLKEFERGLAGVYFNIFLSKDIYYILCCIFTLQSTVWHNAF
jgi:hypothetical protein